TETALSGWDISAVTCDDAASLTPSAGFAASGSASFKLDPGETVTCTFTNTKRGTIGVKKLTKPAGEPTQFNFAGTAAGTIGDGGTITTGNLVPGNYTSTEAAVSGWALTSISCDDGGSTSVSTGNKTSGVATFRLDPGENVTCTYTNSKRGTI